MSRSRAVERRYWIIGVLCSLAFHGLILFLPLRLASVQPTISRTLRVGLVAQAVAEPENSAQKIPAFPPKTQEPTLAKKILPQQMVKPEQAANTVADASEEKSLGSETAVSEEKSEGMLTPPIFTPADVAGHEFVGEQPRDESAVVGAAAEEPLAVSASLPTAQSPISTQDLYQEQRVLQKLIDIAETPSGAPSGSISDEKLVESPKENVQPVMAAKSYAGVAEAEGATVDAPPASQTVIPEFVARVAKEPAATEVVAAPELKNSMAIERKALEEPVNPEKLTEAEAPVDVPAATPKEVASRQYFAVSDGLFAHTENVAGAPLSSTKKSDNVSAPQADSSDTRMALGTNSDSQTDLVAEKNAERKSLYNNGKSERGESAKIAQAEPGQSIKEGLGFEQKGVSGSSGIQNVEGHQIQSASVEAPDSAVTVDVQSGISEEPPLKAVENKEVSVEMAGESVDMAQVTSQPQPQQKVENLSSTSSLSATALSDSIASAGTPVEKASVSKESDQSEAIQPKPQSQSLREVEAAPAIPGPAPADSVLPHFDTVEALSQRILAALSIQKEYPAAALKRRTEGIVKLSIDVAANGSLIVAKIQARSGSAILDGAALKLVQSIFPLDVRLASAVSLVVPVEYRIPR